MNSTYIHPEHPQQHPDAGFTIVEAVVTLIVLGIFLFGLFQSYFALESQRVIVARQAYASDVAYSNLRKVVSRPAGLTQTVCSDNAAAMDLSVGDASSKPGLDITPYGYTLEPEDDVKKALGANATQTLVAYAPDGCGNLNFSSIKVVSTVTFGNNGDKATHAAFVR